MDSRRSLVLPLAGQAIRRAPNNGITQFEGYQEWDLRFANSYKREISVLPVSMDLDIITA
jgi:hypothetical protein